MTPMELMAAAVADVPRYCVGTSVAHIKPTYCVRVFDKAGELLFVNGFFAEKSDAEAHAKTLYNAAVVRALLPLIAAEMAGVARDVENDAVEERNSVEGALCCHDHYHQGRQLAARRIATAILAHAEKMGGKDVQR